MKAVLEARALAFGHRGVRLGEGVDLGIAPGEVLCLLGPNGCGKTTLFRTLLGLLPTLAGEVWLVGRRLRDTSRRDVARRMAYVPQAQTGAFAYAVEDIVLLGRAAQVGAFSVPSAQDRRVALQSLEQLGIAHLRQRRYTEISGGERQLVLIARALAQEATLLIMDEPTASLDFGNQIRVLRQIDALRRQGIAVCLSTHQPEHALRVGDRVALMQAGRILAVGAAREVMTPESLAALYGVAPADIPPGLLLQTGTQAAAP